MSRPPFKIGGKSIPIGTRQFVELDVAALFDLTRISIPLEIIHGKLDPLVPFDEGKKTAELIPNSKFIAVDKMRHLIDEPVLDVIEAPLIEHLRSSEVN